MKDFLEKISSGRYILTIVCGIVFAYCAVRKIIPPDAVIAIVSTVFISYFQRTDRSVPSDTAQTTTTEQTTTKQAEVKP